MKTPKINSRILKLEVLKDTATRASVNAVESRTTSLESDVATLTQGIQDAVSTHNTAPDSHADLRTAIAHNADHAALSNVLPSTASQNHLTDDELEFFGTLPSTISDLMSNVEEVDADFVSISYNPSGGGGSVAEVTPGPQTTACTYVSDGDANGIIAARVSMGASPSLSTSGSVDGGTLLDLIDRGTDDIYISGAVGTWVQLDFGADCTVSPNYFAIRNNSNNYDPLRNWEWRGSNDLTTWDVLDTRVSDTTLNGGSVWGGWSPNGELGGSYRYLRLVRTGATGGGEASYIRIGELEVYGAVTMPLQLPAWATVWLSDGAYVWAGRPL